MTEEEWLTEHLAEALFCALADPLSPRKSRLLACACCRRVWSAMTDPSCRHAVALSEPDSDVEKAFQADLLRDIFGNPFRPVAFDPTRRSEAAVEIAAGIYEDRAFERMPILAGALQDAGCDHPDILSHCREPGTHVRGCWAVDLVMGKE